MTNLTENQNHKAMIQNGFDTVRLPRKKRLAMTVYIKSHVTRYL